MKASKYAALLLLCLNSITASAATGELFAWWSSLWGPPDPNAGTTIFPSLSVPLGGPPGRHGIGLGRKRARRRVHRGEPRRRRAAREHRTRLLAPRVDRRFEPGRRHLHHPVRRPRVRLRRTLPLRPLHQLQRVGRARCTGNHLRDRRHGERRLQFPAQLLVLRPRRGSQHQGGLPPRALRHLGRPVHPRPHDRRRPPDQLLPGEARALDAAQRFRWPGAQEPRHLHHERRVAPPDRLGGHRLRPAAGHYNRDGLQPALHPRRRSRPALGPRVRHEHRGDGVPLAAGRPAPEAGQPPHQRRRRHRPRRLERQCELQPRHERHRAQPRGQVQRPGAARPRRPGTRRTTAACRRTLRSGAARILGGQAGRGDRPLGQGARPRSLVHAGRPVQGHRRGHQAQQGRSGKGSGAAGSGE